MAKNSSNKRIFTLNCNGKLIVIDRPQVMGIINITPDSFYAGSRMSDKYSILKHVEQMLVEGAGMIDVGGQSTRPGSERITVEEELARVLPAVELLSKEFPHAIISIDTFYSKVVWESVGAGASMVNDTTCGSVDSNMLRIVGSLNVPYVCMHSQGTPATMQQKPAYENVTTEVIDFFILKVEECIQAGIKDVIIDPGFGFGKGIRHNLELLKNLNLLKIFDKPLLMGISRKSTIYKILNTTAEGALNGTTVLHTIGLMNGANILRVHDVKEAKEAIVLYEEYNNT